MGAPGKLTDAMKDEAVSLAATRSYSAAKIADYLKRGYGVEVTRQAITKVLRERRSDTAETAKTAAREKAGDAVGAAFDELKKRLEGLAKLAAKTEKAALDSSTMFRKDAVDAHAKVIRELAALTEIIAKHSGADEPDKDLVDGLAELLGLAFDDDDDEEDDE